MEGSNLKCMEILKNAEKSCRKLDRYDNQYLPLAMQQ